jgi:putative copper export protein
MLAEFVNETAVLRALVYTGTIAAVGACLFAATFPSTAQSVRTVLRLQIIAGMLLILLVEPLRLILFQLSISGGDVALALSPDMRWLAFEMPNGQAAAARVTGVALIAVLGLRFLPAGLFGSAIVIGSYALEGHTASSSQPVWASLALLLHVAVAHWWIGSLWPLAASVKALPHSAVAATVERFGHLATMLVPVLLIAGGVLFLVLVSWTLEFTASYQQIIAAKVATVVALLAIATFNKFVITPRLRTDPTDGAKALRGSIAVELALAFSILVLTGFVTTTSPGSGH